MPRAKIPRKSTNVDMTAMCDVAFLLLSFFILATRPKSQDALDIATPSSVSADIIKDKNSVLVTIDKDAKVYFSVSDKNIAERRAIIDGVNTTRHLGLTDAEKARFVQTPENYIGVPFSQLKSYLDRSEGGLKGLNLPGIPVKDSSNNELIDWMRAAIGAFEGSKMSLFVRGDNAAKYPSFQAVIYAFKKNDLLKFQLITNPVAAPAGSELEKASQKTAADKTLPLN